MSKSRRPISFLATTDPDLAQAFYRDVIGLTLVENTPYALVFGDGENMLRVQVVTDLVPATHTVHGWKVTDIDQDIRDLTSKGVTFLTFNQLDQDSTGIWTTPDGNKIAWFKDPSGNILSLTQFLVPPVATTPAAHH